MNKKTGVLLGAGLWLVGAYAWAADSAVELQPVKVEASFVPSYVPPPSSVGGKTAQSMREIPQSVSVLTREQMDDQNMVTMEEALRHVTGVNVISNDTLSAQYYARGYSLGVMYDGIPSYNGMTPSHQFDLWAYEQIEVLRGPSGWSRGVGDPGGVVNLVKKAPSRVPVALGQITWGAWNNFRFDGDFGGALNEAGTLRTRAVVSREERDYFYDQSHSAKWLLMGSLAMDLGDKTEVGVSLMAQDADVTAPWSGLPTSTDIDENGHYRLLDVSRSTFNAPKWGFLRYKMQESGAWLKHKLAGDWQLEARFNDRRWQQTYKYAYTSSSLNTTTGRLNYKSLAGDYDYRRSGFDVYAHGSTHWFDRKQQFVFGFNSEIYENKGRSARGPSVDGVLFSDGDWLPQPDLPYTSGNHSQTRQYGVYGQGRFELVKDLTLVLGGRVSSFKSRSRAIGPSAASGWRKGAEEQSRFTPYAGLLYDVNRNLTLYASYADIFVPQTQLKASGDALDPRIGRQIEVGVKGVWLDGKVNTSLAWFDLRDRNRAYPDPDYPDDNYYINIGEVQSRGFEAEISGRLLPGLDVAAGYTYLTTRYRKDASSQGKVYSIASPRHQFKLWANYHFAPDSALSGVSAGLGLYAISKAQSTRGRRDEVINKGYAVVDAHVAWKMNRHSTLKLSINNLLDKKYYASVGTTNIYNFYGEPRNLRLTWLLAY